MDRMGGSRGHWCLRCAVVFGSPSIERRSPAFTAAASPPSSLPRMRDDGSQLFCGRAPRQGGEEKQTPLHQRPAMRACIVTAMLCDQWVYSHRLTYFDA